MLAVTLPPKVVADINILNIFKQGDGDEITFNADGFEVKEAIVNGQTVNFARYVTDKNIDTKLPLVADYSGAAVNISIQTVDPNKESVVFYAPVFKGVRYRFASPVENYFKDFMAQVLEGDYKEYTSSNLINKKSIMFSCNCILNYLYSNWKG